MSAPSRLDEALLRGLPLPAHRDGDDKDARGSVLVVGGSLEVPGAVLLAGEAALRAGAGRLQVAVPRSLAPPLGLALPEALAMGLPESPEGGIAPTAAGPLRERAGRVDALLVGPGMAGEAATAALVGTLLAALPEGEGPAILLDACALTRLPEGREALRRHAGRIVVTPHAGEMASLLGTGREAVLADPLGAARRAAAQLQAVVAMKGGRTFVVTPQGEAWICEHGCVGLGTSGSGDTLAGIVAGLLARGAAPAVATLWGVWLHAEAGQRLSRRHGPVGFLAREIPGEVPAIMAGLAKTPGDGAGRGVA
ncbi:NAD(P)H-hydrate dehydratase [Roseomonas sp. OT10]|uniref:NAD(P)H-hydrate dehydratase n=1 Tax=Roseomonas cutis TaxID=2897332 RepID=UPI001E34EADB|nr:NAD(P)H-hydrate dehydratase [Roseomonas sp. OT10]UFN49469.1 NAD(P)H-hydrate dehydratase [Roseomonas sp. OT10]